MEIENNKDMFKFFNEFIFLDHKKVGVDVKVNDLRKSTTKENINNIITYR